MLNSKLCQPSTNQIDASKSKQPPTEYNFIPYGHLLEFAQSLEYSTSKMLWIWIASLVFTP